MAKSVPHISVCICTFKRSRLLSCLLHELDCQKTEGSFTYSVMIVDNDVSESSREVVSKFQKASSLQVSYEVESEQNIALARNKALANAEGDFIAFIDDDEVPAIDWLINLFQTCQERKIDGVLGPVLPRFEKNPPIWVKKGGFCDRPTHATGFRINWNEGRTGNLLIRRGILAGLTPVFRPEFGSGGEDRDFFRRMIERGRVFVWCNEAVVYEWVPSLRWKRSFLMRRALLRGKMALKQHRGFGDLAKSLFAVIGYILALPILFVVGHHLFMKYLIKTCDHFGKLLAFMGLDPIQEKYVTE
jgi:glycosyltransferase involved in cell wall biosynthesis